MTNTHEFDGCGISPTRLSFLLGCFGGQVTRRDARRRHADVGLEAWGRHYLADHFTRPASRMHEWLFDRLSRMSDSRGRKINVLGPRGGAKSTLGTLAYPLRAAVEAQEHYIWIVSDTADQARAHLNNLKSELLDNRRLRRDYPEATGKGPVWRSGAIMMTNGVAIEAFGTGQRIRGRRHRAHRPTLIICDDLQNDSHMISGTLRRHSDAWFHGTLLKAGTSRTNVLNLATALHREALAMQLLKTPGWTSRVFRAIESWPDNMSLWDQWQAIYTDLDNPDYRDQARQFYEEHRPEMDAGVELLWPEEEDLYMLMCLRTESGSAAFEREKQNSPINPDLCEWPDSYFDESIWFDQWPEGMTLRTLALDPSKGRDASRGDYSAFVQLGVGSDGTLYVEADLARRPTPEIIDQGVEIHRRFRPDAFGVESNQFQELLGQEFVDAFQKEGMLAAEPYLVNNRVNKRVRIRRLGPYLRSGRLRFKSDCPSTRMLVNQLREFPIGDHDDGPDALEMAIRLAENLLRDDPTGDGLGGRLPVG